MTLDDAIKHAEEVAEINQRVVDTGIVFDDVTIDMLYCDDTEVIEEQLAIYQRRADEHRQLAEWLKDYKRFLEQQPSNNCVSLETCKQVMWERDIAIEQLKELGYEFGEKIRASEDCIARQPLINNWNGCADMLMGEGDSEIVMGWIFDAPPVTPTQRWIPVSERLPKDLEPVNITWVNHNPESYYANIKDKPFTASGVYFNGQWYWWSTFCNDILAEYSHDYDGVIDNDIEITAWQPLPKPYEERRGDEDGSN